MFGSHQDSDRALAPTVQKLKQQAADATPGAKPAPTNQPLQIPTTPATPAIPTTTQSQSNAESKKVIVNSQTASERTVTQSKS